MPLYSMVSEKMYQGVYFSNRYILSAATLAAAVISAGEVRTYEREVAYDTLTFTKYRVSDMVEGTDVYQVINDNVTGVIHDGFGAPALPLWMRVRVDFNTDGGGRPSRKYMVVPLKESDIVGDALEATVVTLFNNEFVTPLVSNAAFVDVDGQAFGSGSVYPKIAMHQLRRGSKRRALPIIP